MSVGRKESDIKDTKPTKPKSLLEEIRDSQLGVIEEYNHFLNDYVDAAFKSREKALSSVKKKIIDKYLDSISDFLSKNQKSPLSKAVFLAITEFEDVINTSNFDALNKAVDAIPNKKILNSKEERAQFSKELNEAFEVGNDEVEFITKIKKFVREKINQLKDKKDSNKFDINAFTEVKKSIQEYLKSVNEREGEFVKAFYNVLEGVEKLERTRLKLQESMSALELSKQKVLDDSNIILEALKTEGFESKVQVSGLNGELAKILAETRKELDEVTNKKLTEMKAERDSQFGTVFKEFVRNKKKLEEELNEFEKTSKIAKISLELTIDNHLKIYFTTPSKEEVNQKVPNIVLSAKAFRDKYTQTLLANPNPLSTWPIETLRELTDDFAVLDRQIEEEKKLLRSQLASITASYNKSNSEKHRRLETRFKKLAESHKKLERILNNSIDQTLSIKEKSKILSDLQATLDKSMADIQQQKEKIKKFCKELANKKVIVETLSQMGSEIDRLPATIEKLIPELEEINETFFKFSKEAQPRGFKDLYNNILKILSVVENNMRNFRSKEFSELSNEWIGEVKKYMARIEAIAQEYMDEGIGTRIREDVQGFGNLNARLAHIESKVRDHADKSYVERRNRILGVVEDSKSLEYEEQLYPRPEKRKENQLTVKEELKQLEAKLNSTKVTSFDSYVDRLDALKPREQQEIEQALVKAEESAAARMRELQEQERKLNEQKAALTRELEEQERKFNEKKEGLTNLIQSAKSLLGSQFLLYNEKFQARRMVKSLEDIQASPDRLETITNEKMEKIEAYILALTQASEDRMLGKPRDVVYLVDRTPVVLSSEEIKKLSAADKVEYLAYKLYIAQNTLGKNFSLSAEDKAGKVEALKSLEDILKPELADIGPEETLVQFKRKISDFLIAQGTFKNLDPVTKDFLSTVGQVYNLTKLLSQLENPEVKKEVKPEPKPKPEATKPAPTKQSWLGGLFAGNQPKEQSKEKSPEEKVIEGITMLEIIDILYKKGREKEIVEDIRQDYFANKRELLKSPSLDSESKILILAEIEAIIGPDKFNLLKGCKDINAYDQAITKSSVKPPM